MKKGIIILLGLAYLLNSPILNSVYLEGLEYTSREYAIQYVEFAATRAKVYECMFFLFFVMVYLQYNGMVKSLAAGFMVMAAGSVVDKVFFNFYSYLYSDYILGAVALIISRRVYVRENR